MIKPTFQKSVQFEETKDLQKWPEPKTSKFIETKPV